MYHTGYLAHGSSEGEARGRSRHENNTVRGVRNMEGRIVDAIKGNGLKQGLTSAEDLTIELCEERDSHYHHRLD